MIKNKFYKINVWFLISAFGMIIILLAATIYSLNLVSGMLVHSFSPADSDQKPVRFEIERAEKLGL